MLNQDLFINYTSSIRPRNDYNTDVKVEVEFVMNNIYSMVRVTYQSYIMYYHIPW